MPRKRKTNKQCRGQATIATERGRLHRKQTQDKSTDSTCKSNINENKSNYVKLNMCSNIGKMFDPEIINNQHSPSKKQAKTHTEVFLGSANRNIATKRASLHLKQNPTESTDSMCKSDITQDTQGHIKKSNSEKFDTEILNGEHVPNRKLAKSINRDLLEPDNEIIATKKANLCPKRSPAESTDSMCKNDINEKKSNITKLNTCRNTKIINNKHAPSRIQEKTHSEDLLWSVNKNTLISNSFKSYIQNSMKIIAVKPHYTVIDPVRSVKDCQSNDKLMNSTKKCQLNDNPTKSTKEFQPKTHAWRIDDDDDTHLQFNMDIPTNTSEFLEEPYRKQALPIRYILVKPVHDDPVKIVKENKNSPIKVIKVKKNPTRLTPSHAWRYDYVEVTVESKSKIRDKSPKSQVKSATSHDESNEQKSPLKKFVKIQQTNENNPLGDVIQNPPETCENQKTRMQSHAWRFDCEGAKESNEKFAVLEPNHSALAYDVQTNFIEVPSLASIGSQLESLSSNFNNGIETCNDEDPLSLNKCAVNTDWKFCEEDWI